MNKDQKPSRNKTFYESDNWIMTFIKILVERIWVSWVPLKNNPYLWLLMLNEKLIKLKLEVKKSWMMGKDNSNGHITHNHTHTFYIAITEATRNSSLNSSCHFHNIFLIVLNHSGKECFSIRIDTANLEISQLS